MVEETALSSGSVTAVGSRSGAISGTWALVMGGRLLLFRPNEPLVEYETVTVTVSGSLLSAGGRTLDGNEDGIAEGNALDDFRLQFMVGTPIGD